MPRPNKKPDNHQNQRLFFFARELEDVYENEALEGVLRVHQQMLELALRDFKTMKTIQDEWLDWLLEDDIEHPLSFARCCEELGYDRERIRMSAAGYIYHHANLTAAQKRKIEIEVF